MKAKIVPLKYCDNAFDCGTCAFDSAMGRKLAKNEHERWQSTMFRKLGSDLRCRHALTGGAPENKMCANSYDCSTCQYDQMLSDMAEADYTVFGQPQYFNAHGYRVPRDYYIHKGHAWARVEYGGRVRIGLDDFGAKLVGTVEKFRLPSLGTRFKLAEESFIVERDQSEAGVKAPLTGIVTAVNQKLIDHPQSEHADPYCGGWVMLIDPIELRPDLKQLAFGVAAVRFIESEAERLLSLVTGEPASAAALGGEPIGDVYGSFKDEIGWDRLVKSFL